MKILVFNGSPKKEKSDTMHITRAFLDGMKEVATQEIHTISVTDKHIKFCRGCFSCKYNGGHCTIDDDMREILEQMGSELYPRSGYRKARPNRADGRSGTCLMATYGGFWSKNTAVRPSVTAAISSI